MYFLITLITVPILLISNYVLGLFSLKIYNKEYKKHITIEKFGTNVSSFKNYLLSIILTVLLICGLFYFIDDVFIQKFLAGYFIISPVLSTSLTLWNLFNFYFIEKYPDSVNGKIFFNAQFNKKSSAFLIFSFLLPFIALAIFTQDPFVYGAIFSIFVVSLIQAKS